MSMTVEAAPGQVKLWTNISRGLDLDEERLRSALEGLGVPAGKLLRAELRDGFSYLFVAEEDVATFEALSGKRLNERELRVERAREEPRPEQPASAEAKPERSERRERPERRSEAQELAELFCRQAKRRAEALFAELWDNDDDAGHEAADRVLDGRYRWLEEGIADPSGEGPMIPDEVKGPAACGAS